MSLTMVVALDGVELDGCAVDADIGILADSISGLGFGEDRIADQPRVGRDGSVAGTDFEAPKVISIPVVIDGHEDPRAAMQTFRALKRAWKRRSDDQVLTVAIPGIGPVDDVLRYYGRPRGTLEPSLRLLSGGYVYALCRFDALDPVGYGPSATTSGSGTFQVTNAGDALSDRATLVVTGNGGTPIITNNSDGGGSIGWRTTLANAVTRSIDLRTMQVTDNAGVDRSSEINAGSTWFTFQPGANELALAGASGLSATLRPGYL